MDVQSSIGIKYNDVSFGSDLKNSDEFTNLIVEKLKELKKKTEEFAINIAAKNMSKKIIDIFMKGFTELYLNEINSDETKAYLNSAIKNCFSDGLKDGIKNLIHDLKEYQKKNE